MERSLIEIAYEYVRDVAKLFHEHDMKCVLVSNGEAGLRPMDASA